MDKYLKLTPAAVEMNTKDETEIDTDNLYIVGLTKNKIDKVKIFYGVLLVFGIGMSWVASTQFAQYAQTKSNVTIPPFALMWFSTSFKVFCFIPVILLKCCNYSPKHIYSDITTPQSISDQINGKNHPNHRAISEIFNAEEYESETLVFHQQNDKESEYITEVMPNNFKMCLIYLLFYCLWTGSNYSYYKALDTNSATIVTAIFSSNNMFIYILSLFILNEKFSLFRMFAVCIAIIGISLIALSNTKSQIVFIGTMLALISSVLSAFYKVFFKKIFGEMKVMNVCIFLSFIGTFNALFMWIVILILHVLDIERLPSEKLNEWPWIFIVGSALFGLCLDFLIAFGIAFTYPLFIALGLIIGIPLNLLVDLIFNGLVVGYTEMMGVVCICAGFFIIVLTDLYGKRGNDTFKKL